MSDELNIPAESWRAPRRRGAGMDPQMLRIGMVAAAAVGVVLLAAGGYAMLGRRPHVVPVVEADSRPLRIRPENPGGAIVEGANEQAMGGHGNGQADAMAPPAEAPAPLALRAQIDAARQPVAPPPAPKVALAAPPPAAIAEPPEARPAVRAPAPAALAPAGKIGALQVQLAALDSEQAARTEWQRLSHRMPDLLSARQPAVLRAERDGKTVWRLRTGGFTDMAQATAFCTQVKSKGAGCTIASF